MAISLVQAKSGTGTSSPTTVTLSSPTTAGNCLIVCWTVLATGSQPSTFSGTLGGSAGNFGTVLTVNSDTGILADPNCAGGQTAVALTFSGGSGSYAVGVYVYEVSGLAASSVVDKTVSGTTGTTSWTSGATATTTNANEFWVGMASCYQTTTQTITGPSSPWTNETAIHPSQGANFLNSVSGYQIVSSTGTCTYAGTVASSGGNTVLAATFLPATSSPVSVTGVTATMTLAAPAGAPSAAASVAGVTATMALAAPAGSAGVVSGVTGPTAALTFAAPAGSVSAAANVAGVTATMSLTAPAGTASGPTVINFINTWTDQATNEYGMRDIAVANSTGNTLVAFIGWNAASGINPVSSVADDAHNWWIPLGTSSASGNVRCSIWIAPNARPAKYVSVSLAQWVGGVCSTIAEATGFPHWAQIDNATVSTNNSTTTQSLSANSTVADLALGIAVVGNVNETVSSTGAGSWFTLSSQAAVQTTGSGTTNICPVWSTPSTGTVTESWSVGSTAPMASLLVLLKLNPATPPQLNPNWPGVKVEIGFGFTPGDPTSMVTWTDVTKRAMQPDGSAIFTSTRGRSYELATPEAGQLTIWLDNHDGAFDPLNTASPYWPNVKLQIPIRISGTWGGSQYPIAFGYISGWPQQWPDPQWGFSPVTAVDAMGVLSNVTMYSAYSSEVLIDAPYSYHPLGEFYDEASGLPFNNLAFGNQRPAYGVDGIATTPMVPLSTGQTLGLFGDSGTGSGQSGLTGTGTGEAGLFYEDPAFPQYTSGGITLEFWANMPTPPTTTCLLQLFGDQPNYLQTVSTTPFTPPILSVNVNHLTGPFCTFGDFTGNYDTSGGLFTVPEDGNPHHHCVILSGATHPTVKYYLDGSLLFTYTSSVASSSNVRYMLMGPPTCFSYYSQATTGNYILGHVAVYNYQLDPARIVKHWSTGLNGSNGDSTAGRFKKILAWGRAYIPKASGLSSASPLMGYADNMATRSIADVLGDITTADQGIVYADAAGNAVYKSRQSSYNQTPKWTFGDNPGEIPYEVDESFAFDNTYLYNQVNGQRIISQSQTAQIGSIGVDPQVFQQYGADAIAHDNTSETEYLPRNALTVSLETSSDEDVYDWVNWNLAKYKEPMFRVVTLTLNPAANPSIWPAALGLEQGDIVQINRRPVGGPVYSVQGIIQSIDTSGGPSNYSMKLTISPYTIEYGVLQLGNASFDSVTTNRIAW